MRNKYLWTALLWTLFITVACLISNDNFSSLETIKIPNKDKFLHGFFYFIFTALWYLGFSRAKLFNAAKARMASFFLAMGYGIIIEVCQGLFTVERTPDVVDAIANTTGAAIGVLALWLYHKRKKINDQSPAF